MIENISINNYALIDHTHIELEKGFSVITGETGAGKSILLGAIGLTLGQRADSSAIMDKTKKCIVEIEYNIAGYALKEWFDENDLDYSEQVMVRRELTAEGKSRCFINDTPVNNKLLKDFGTYMIDIHSQHQSLLLGHPEYQTDILDAFCGNRELSELYQADFRERQQLKSALKQLKDRAADAEKESDYLQFQFNQLESARLQLGEKEALEEELELLTHAENIKSALSGLSWNLRDTEQSVIQVLKGSRNAISALENAFKEAGEYRERLDSVAHTRVKTPTAAAEFLIESMDSAADELEMLASRLHEGVRNLLQQEQRRLSGYKNRIPSAAYHRISDAKMALLTVRKDVVQAVTSSLFRHRHRLELLQQRLADASPEKLLARGYSITLKDGKVVKNADELQENDMITTRLQNGEVVSIVHI